MAKEFRRIIAPVDGSEESKYAARKAIFLAERMGVDVVAIYGSTWISFFRRKHSLPSTKWKRWGTE